jgi:hypothetical protein
MHLLVGEVPVAVARLRTALAARVTGEERLECLRLLLRAEGQSPPKDYAALCDELETLMEEGPPRPDLRIDLAEALRVSGLQDADRIERALRQAERSLPGLTEQGRAGVGELVIARCLVALVRLTPVDARPDVLVRVRRLLEPMPLPAAEIGELRYATAHNLLEAGPLCHPDAIALADGLRALARYDLGADPRLDGVEARLAWIRGAQAGELGVRRPPAGMVPGPLDDCPPWLVAWVVGRRATAAPSQVLAGLVEIQLALRWRPDAADRVCANLVRASRTMNRHGRNALLPVVLQVVQGNSRRGAAWPDLEAALQGLRRDQRDAATRSLEAALRQARGEDPERPVARDRGVKIKKEDQALLASHEAVELMHLVHPDPHHPDAGARIALARALLSAATEFARTRKLPNYPDFLISLGNAWKMPPGEDLERALRCYERARPHVFLDQQRAKLDKVEADALLLRGGEDDLRRAVPLLERSIRLRTGEERAASQVSLAGVLRRHPDLERDEQIIRAAEQLMAATRSAPGLAEETLATLLPLLGTWQRRRPNDARPAALRAELAERYPRRRDDIERPTALPSEETERHIESMAGHPAGRVYLRVAARLLTRAEARGVPLMGLERLSPSAVAEIFAHLDRERLLGDPAGLERALADLGEPSVDDPARPGILVARARLLAELCRVGHRELPAVRAASDLALVALRTLEATLVRAALTRELARVWAPADSFADPLRDFALAVGITREAVQLDEEAGSHNPDILELLARALRHSPEGDPGTNLRESRALYIRLVEFARAEGIASLLANSQHCLAEVEAQLGEGDRLAHLRVGEGQIEEALRLADSPFRRAAYQSSLAWQRTQVGLQQAGEEAVATLRGALATFAAVDLDKLEAHERARHDHNRTVAEAVLAHLTEGRQAEVAIWRRRLGEVEGRGSPNDIAITQHNLANALLADGRVGASGLREGLGLCRQAFAVRTLQANPRHHFETSHTAGAALAAALHPHSGFPPVELPGSPRACWDEARAWLRSAVMAGRVLGQGEELARAGLSLADLAASAPTTQDTQQVAEEAWAAVEEAAGSLLATDGFRAAEAHTALEIAGGLSYRLAREGVLVQVDGLAFVLDGERAELVLRWVLRSQGVVRRPLVARLRRPEGVPMSAWMDWLAALDGGEPEALVGPLSELRAAAPTFLRTDPDLSPTWRWLEARPGAVAVTVLFAEPIPLAVLLSVGAGGKRRVQVLGLPVPIPSEAARGLPRVTREALQYGERVWSAHREATAWARAHIIQPIERFLGGPPALVLWCPTDLLRSVSPRALWDGLPVASTASLVLPDLGFAPARPRATLVVLADPGDGSNGDLGEHGRAAEAAVVREASARGAVFRLGSVGARSGRALWGDSAGVLPCPASATEVLEHARDHDLIVLIAHGEAATPETAAILCLDASGAVDRLDVGALGRSPGRFTGATVLLLSCESGSIGEALHEPGGIAGALVSAGARAVVAPLWPVRLDLAQRVAVRVMEGLRQGMDPWETLAVLEVEAEPGGPAVGPSPPCAEQRGQQRQDRFSASLQRLAFVTWVG